MGLWKDYGSVSSVCGPLAIELRNALRPRLVSLPVYVEATRKDMIGRGQRERRRREREAEERGV